MYHSTIYSSLVTALGSLGCQDLSKEDYNFLAEKVPLTMSIPNRPYKSFPVLTIHSANETEFSASIMSWYAGEDIDNFRQYEYLGRFFFKVI
jgi:hypothetical protein